MGEAVYETRHVDKTEHPPAKKNLLGTLSYTIDKNELKMVQRPKPKSQMYKTPRSKRAGTVSGNWTHK